MQKFILAVVVVCGVLATPARALADIRLTPFAGVTFFDEEKKGNFGAALTVGSLIGFEFEAARTLLGTFDDIPGISLDAHATTYMGNVVVRLPVGPVQPYGSAGVGIIRVTGDVDVPIIGNVISATARDVGWNVGGGVYLLPLPNFGIRGDIRHFRTGDLDFDDIPGVGDIDDLPLPSFDFWRATVGITLKF